MAHALTFAEVLIGGGAGLLAGSFLGTLAVRWGRGETVSRGRSHCDGCRAGLGVIELIPLASYLGLRGRCRRCGAAIDPRHPIMEAVCAVIGALALATQPGLAGWSGALFGWTLAALALTDLDHYWLPDALVLPLAGAGLVAGLAGLPPQPVDRVIGAAGGFAALAAIALAYRRLRGRTGLGAGDPKLLAAIGAWLGWRLLPFVLIGAAGLGLLWCLAAMLRGRGMALTDRLPLGTLMAAAAWPLWLAAAWSLQ